MADGDHYRVRAKECTEAAAHSTEPERRVALLELAQRWQSLAEQADEIERSRVGRGDALLPEEVPSPPLSDEQQGKDDESDPGDAST
jgi:hypothetical protein